MSKMRKSVQRDTNLLTNEFTEVVRDKVDQNVRGQITVQLFDEKGDMIRESYTENIIQSCAESVIPSAYLGMFTDSTNFDGNDNQSYQTIGLYGSLGRLYLRDYDGEENLDDFYMRGNSVAYKNYSDTNNGECSLTQLEDGRAKLHLVYDFATNEANGTINSLYFTPTQGDKTTPLWGTIYRSMKFGGRQTDFRDIVADRDGNFLRVEWDKSLRGYRYHRVKNTELVSLCGVKVDCENSYTHMSHIQDSEGNYYHFRSNIPVRDVTNIAIAPQDRFSNVTVIRYGKSGEKLSEATFNGHEYIKSSSVPFPDSTNCYAMDIIPLMSIEDVVYFLCTYRTTTSASSSGGHGYILGYNVKSNSLASVYRYSTSSLDYGIMLVTGDKYTYSLSKFGLTSADYLPYLTAQIDGRKFNLKTENTKTYYAYPYSNYLVTADSSGKLVWSPTTNIFGPNPSSAGARHPYFTNSFTSSSNFIHSYNSNLRTFFFISTTSSSSVRMWSVFPMPTYLSHTKLPNPIIKTSANTMKIQYDFIFPLPKCGRYRNLSEVYPPEVKMTSGVSE